MFWLRVLMFWTRLQNLDSVLRASWHLKKSVLAAELCALHSSSAKGTDVSSVCLAYYVDIIKKARKFCKLKMHQGGWMGAAHLPRISGHSATQLELYQYSRHLQVPNERPDFSFSPRFYFRQKKVFKGTWLYVTISKVSCLNTEFEVSRS